MLAMGQPSNEGPVRCICGECDDMGLVAESKEVIIFECDSCHRLLMRGQFVSVQQWFKPEEQGLVSLTTAKEEYCEKCRQTTVYIRYLDDPWLCLGCRIRESERQLKKEGD
jgi:ribosomal protein L37AE/L43A